MTDIDGVWTDGGMYYTDSGAEYKRFNTRDSAGVLLLKWAQIEPVIITQECTNIVKNRAEKLKISHVLQGVRNKMSTSKEFLVNIGSSLDNCAYIGDDYADIELLRSVRISACPADATQAVRMSVDWVLETKGGEGVFREFVERYFIEVLNLNLNEVYKDIYTR